MKTFVILFAVVMNLVLADAVTKELAEHLLVSGDSFTIVPGFFDLTLVHNRGCAWGMFQGQVWPLAAVGILALVVLIWKRNDVFDFKPREVARRTIKTPHFFTFPFSFFLFSEPLLYAGILGNVIDRIWRGYVIDMFDFHWKNAYHYPCFNLADVYICVAAGLLILSSLVGHSRYNTSADAADTDHCTPSDPRGTK